MHHHRPLLFIASLGLGITGVLLACSSDSKDGAGNTFTPNEAGAIPVGEGGGGGEADGDVPDDVTPRAENVLSKGAPCARRENKQVVCWGYGYGPEPKQVPGVADITYVNGYYGRKTTGEIVQWINTPDASAKNFTSLDPILDMASNPSAFIARSVVQQKIQVIREGTSTCGSLAVAGENVSVATILPWPELNGAKRLALGTGHGCAIRKDDSVVCWGRNTKGQLGHAPDSEGDERVGADACNAKVVAVPGFQAKEIAIGSSSTCAIGKADNKVYCWGNNADGALGRGAATPEFDPAPQPIAGVLGVSDVAGRDEGDLNTWCAASNGIVYCWGNNNAAQLGKVGPSSPTPAQVLNIGNVEELSISTTAVFARDKDNTIKAWGGNDQEMLGHARNTNGDIAHDGGIAGASIVNPNPATVIQGR